ncbi:PT domain-containing protein [Faecalibacterium sp. Marseille-P9312]|uniref:PT domain-containing protein n=1 Tax=Faecalibacterium sp. Marseille-P9312 TaxID=2580425 RepID=UPI00122C3E0A|nr:PT domain-containing protein [Faecalibacterium sp. Marseille-P9312]
MQRKDLALRVLSTAAIMSIVTSIAAPAFANVYYIGNGSIDVETVTDANGEQYVKVTQGKTTYTDTSDEIVIKDGNNEGNAAQKEENRIEGKRAGEAVPDSDPSATQELEAAGPAAGESQPDPNDAFTLSEEEEDSEEGKDSTDNPTENPTDNPTEKPTENPTDDPTANSKKDVVYQYDPAADPDSEQQATKLAPTTSAAPAAKTKEVTLDDAPATTAPAEGSAKKPTTNVIRVINNWAEKVLNIRLSNVNIKVDDTSRYADGTREHRTNGKDGVAAAEVQGTGKTKIELDGQNLLDSSTSEYWAGLNKKDSGNLTITDETSDKGETITAKEEADTSGSLRAKGGIYGGAAIGGNSYEATDNITIEGYATVNANILKNTFGLYGAGIGGGCSAKGSNITIQGHANVTANGGTNGAGIGGGGQDGYRGGDAENITIQDYAKVTATGQSGAAIGGGFGQSKSGSAKHIVIQGHATVDAKGSGAAIGAAYGDNAEVTIGTAGATAEQEDVHVTATSSYGAAIGNGAKDTKVTIQGHVTIQTALGSNSVAIGSQYGNVTVNIKDNASIDTATGGLNSSIGGWSFDIDSNRKDVVNKVVVNIDGGEHGKVKIGENSAIFGADGAISGTEVKIGNNVLLKIKQSLQNSEYIDVNNAEAAVGKRNNPDAGGLVNTIGDNTELWYTDFNGVLQKIVHGKNVCTKNEIGRKDATCTEEGWVEYECNYEAQNNATGNSCGRTWKETIPALGHHWKDNGDGTHTCTNCGATEALPSDTNSALELRVVDAEGMDQPFTVSQNGTLRTYTGAYDVATLTGDLDTLRYLQDHGAQTIQFVTNGQTSSFAINDLLAQGSGSEVFYLTHRGAEEPTLLLVEADHSELVKD